MTFHFQKAYQPTVIPRREFPRASAGENLGYKRYRLLNAKLLSSQLP
jgi:hypothetical protein